MLKNDQQRCPPQVPGIFEELIASLPNIPDKEVVISELDGAVLLSPTVVILLMPCPPR
jgi:hypothetical protein